MSCLRSPAHRSFLHLCVLVSLLFSALPHSVAPLYAQDTTQDTAGQNAMEQDAAGKQIFLPLVANTGQAAPAPVTSPTPPSATDNHAMDDYALAELARQRDEAPFVAPEARATGPLNQVGQWGPVVTWPFVLASAATLPDGRIIAWGGNNVNSFSGGSFTYSSIWDPTTGQFLSRNRSGHSMFCAIPTMMEDGRVFVNGGDGDSPLTSIFDYRTNQWSSSNTMNTGRWYPGSVMLPNATKSLR